MKTISEKSLTEVLSVISYFRSFWNFSSGLGERQAAGLKLLMFILVGKF